jgi:hypothetical protein
MKIIMKHISPLVKFGCQFFIFADIPHPENFLASSNDTALGEIRQFWGVPGVGDSSEVRLHSFGNLAIV